MYYRFMRKEDTSGFIAGVEEEMKRIKENRNKLKDEMRQTIGIVYAGDVSLFINDNNDMNQDTLSFITELWNEIKTEENKTVLNDIDLNFLIALDNYVLENDLNINTSVINDDELLRLYRLSLSQYNYNFDYYIDRIFYSDYAGYIDYIYKINNYYEMKK